MFRRLGHRVFWTSVSGLGVGLGALSAAHWSKGPSTSPDASLLRALPLNLIGITAHYAGSIPIPASLRPCAFKAYCSAVGCDVNEVAEDLRSFQSLSAFFGRKLRPEVRPVDNSATLVIPCDGTIVEVGPVGAYGAIEVKNVKYRIRELVGAGEREPLAESSVAVVDKKESGLRLWYTVIHIGPGQCHHFASPANWRVVERRHMEGHLLWMNPQVERLYTENERVAMLGSWEHGLFAMAAVGAVGRGSIAVNFEEENFHPRFRPSLKKISSSKYSTPKTMKPGQALGAFKLGSAIVLIFEAPEQSFKFHVQSGDQVKLGQKLATLDDHANWKVGKHDMNKSRNRNNEGVEYGTPARFRRAW